MGELFKMTNEEAIDILKDLGSTAQLVFAKYDHPNMKFVELSMALSMAINALKQEKVD